MNIDIEIYLNQFISFFEKNPDSLFELIGNIDKNDFFSKVKEKCLININKGDDVSLTRSQIIEIVVELNNSRINEYTPKYFQNTRVGIFCLN